MYTWKQLKEMWEHDNIAMEQVIGQLLVRGEHELTLFTQEQRRREKLEDALAELKKAVEALQMARGQQR